MNRSLEALAIFTICLGGILAAVRISTKDQATHGRTVAERPSTSAVPEQGSSSAREGASDKVVAEEAFAAEVALVTSNRPATIATELFSFPQGCGFDRVTGHVYSAFPPFATHDEVVARAIRSQPLPVYVLPDSEALAEQPLLIDTASAREYAAAELAAAGVEWSSQPTDRHATWRSISVRWNDLAAWTDRATRHYHFAYVAPAQRALENRWSNSALPQLLEHPRARAEARRKLLLQQRAEAERVGNGRAGRVTWDDYLAFADQNLGQPRRTNAIARNLRGQGNELLQSSTRSLAGYVRLAEMCLQGTSERLERVATKAETDPLWESR